MAADLAFDICEVSKTYGRRRALDRVSLRIGRGEMVALIGPSGSGKSTLLRALSGLVQTDAGPGRIDALDQPVQANGRLSDQVRRVRARIGFISQQFNLTPRLTLFSNVMIGALGRTGFWRGLAGLWSREDKALGMAALVRVGVAEQAGQRASTLSGGQQQRGAIARTLVQRAEAVLADEPIASLDPGSARRVMEILRDLNRDDGLTVIVSLHQVDYATRYCDRAIALKAGAIAFDGPVQSLDRDRLIDIYGADSDDVGLEAVVQESDRP